MEFVWRALSSPHRRQILDLLREGPLTTGQVSRHLPDLSRFAVMQHLQVLEEANLVVTRKEGRTRFNYSNPIPIREELGRWMNNHAMAAAETALHLRKYAESQQEKLNAMNEAVTNPAFRIVKIEMEMTIKASPSAVYRALVQDLDAWWPHRFRPDSTIVVDDRLGGLIEERYAAGGGAIFGTIMMMDPGRRFASSSPSYMNRSFYSFNEESFDEHADGCLYKKSLTLFGDVSEQTEVMFRDGARALMEKGLREYLEQGIGYVKPGVSA